MSRCPCHWTLSCLPSSLLSSSFIFFFNFILGFLAHTPYTHSCNLYKSYLPPPPGGQKIFFIILGRQVAGETSDLVGCACVCAMRVCVGGPFSLPLSLFTLYPFIVTSSVITTFFLSYRSSTVEKGELSIFYPSIHSSVIQLLQITFSFFFYVLYLWTDWTLENSSTAETVLFLVIFYFSFSNFFKVFLFVCYS